MIALISLLVEKSQGDDNQLQILEKDYNSLIGGKVSFLKLESMIALISLLVEKSQGDDNQLQISEKDYNSLIEVKVSFLKLRVNDSSDLTVGREVSGRWQSTTDLRERL